MQIMKQIKAKYKYLMSFFKSEWAFKDYPLETWLNPNAAEDEIKYGAMFSNWQGLVAHGKTTKDGIEPSENLYLVDIFEQIKIKIQD